jgi:DNA mismatch repair protein MSH2
MRLDAAALRALNLFPEPGQAGAMSAAAAAASSAAGAGFDDDANDAAAGGSSSSSSSSSSAGKKAAGGGGGAGSSSSSYTRSGISNLHALLSHGCRTKGGKRVLKTWILQPLVDLPAIQRRQSLVAAFVNSTVLRKSWRESTTMPDLEALSARITRKAASLVDLLRLYQFALALPHLVQRLKQAYEGPDAALATDEEARYSQILSESFLNPLGGFAEELATYRAMVEKVVEDPTNVHEPRVNPEWDEKLKELADERDKLEGEVLSLYEDATRSSSSWANQHLGGDLKCEKDSAKGGYVFRTKRTNEKALRSVPGVSILSVLKDGIYFTTGGSSGLRKISERLSDVEREYSEKSREVVAQALEVARTYCPVLEGCGSLLGELDAYYSLAHLACSAPGSYVLPTLVAMSDKGDIDITEARHPVMEMMPSTGPAGSGGSDSSGSGSFIPNDYNMKREDSRFVVLTGPNMVSSVGSQHDFLF